MLPIATKKPHLTATLAVQNNVSADSPVIRYLDFPEHIGGRDR
jgi:hypothetical protein